LGEDLYVRKESATFRRLLTSQHVRDLRVIFCLAFLVTVCDLVILVSKLPGTTTNDTRFESLMAVAGVGGAIMAWAYQAGSKRLGVVDLFACEITTLCRVGTVVGMIRHLANAFEARALCSAVRTGANQAEAMLSQFTSQENYFPVFDGNASDLQILEADVVTNVTAFYTFMKVMRDYLRKLSNIPRGGNEVVGDEWHNTMLNTIYMVLLSYESARKAICDLIEFQPTRAETTVVVLLTELPAYRFLFDHAHENAQRSRLELRRQDYVKDVEKLYHLILRQKAADKSGRAWDQAFSLTPELKRQYEAALNITL
jgi:hypothetical protein